MKKILILLLLIPFLQGCGFVYAYRTMQIQTDRQAILRMYRQCLEQYKEQPDKIKEFCDPIVTPLRIEGLR